MAEPLWITRKMTGSRQLFATVTLAGYSGFLLGHGQRGLSLVNKGQRMSFEIYEPTEEDRRRMLLDAEAKRQQREANQAAVVARFIGSDPKPPTAEDVMALRSMPLSCSLPAFGREPGARPAPLGQAGARRPERGVNTAVARG